MDLAHEPALKLGDIDVRPSTREILFPGGREVLEPRVMMVLVLLARAGGEVVSRDRLVESCWDGRIVSDDAVNRVISRIRRVSELTAGRDFALETITKVGYRLVVQSAATASPTGAPAGASTGAPALRPAEPSAAPSPVQPAAAAPASQDAPASPSPLRRRIALAAAGLALLLALVAGGWLLLRPDPASAAPKTLTLAVLPFDSLSPGHDDGTLALGMSREIRNTLSRVRGLRVVSDASSFAVAAEHLSATDMRRRLGADLLLDGSCIRDGDTVKLTAELVDAWTGANVWTGSQAGPVTDLDRLRALMSAAIFEQLAVRIGPKRLEMTAPPRTEDPRIYRLMLEAKEMVSEGSVQLRHGDIEAAQTRGRRAAELIDAALKIDPAAPAALALKSDLIINGIDEGAVSGGVPLAERVSKAEEYLRRALAVDPDNTFALQRLAEAYRRNDWRWTEARELFERALALDPNDFDTRVFYSFYLSAAGRCVEALEQARAAMQLDPENRDRNDVLTPRILKCLGQLEESDRLYLALLDKDRANLFDLTEIYIELVSRGDAPALRRLVRHMHDEVWQGAPSQPVQAVLDRMTLAADALDGRPTPFLALLKADLADIDSPGGKSRLSIVGRRSGDTLWTYAVEFAAAGDARTAVDVLGRAIAAGSLYIPENMPYGAFEFTPAVRADPRYQALWASDPRLAELKRLRLKALQERQMMGVLPDGRLVKPK